MNDQQYCIVATDRKAKVRAAISGPMSFGSADTLKKAYAKNATWKKTYKYFHVAKHPYKEIKKIR